MDSRMSAGLWMRSLLRLMRHTDRNWTEWKIEVADEEFILGKMDAVADCPGSDQSSGNAVKYTPEGAHPIHTGKKDEKGWGANKACRSWNTG